MKSSKLTTRALAAIALAAGAFLSQAQAAVVITIVPSAPTINVGDPLGVDIFVSGLTQALGGFAFNVNYDGTRLGLLGLPGFVADPDTKMGNLLNPALDLSLGPLGASVNFGVLAGFFFPADEAVLFALHGASFRLGRLDLTGISPGFASIGISGFSLSSYDGLSTIPSSAQGARVCVGGNCVNQIPEPTTPLLVLAALGALAMSRKQKSA